MSAEKQARALMVRHQQLIKHREQSMLSRAAVDVGLPAESDSFWHDVQRQPHVHLSDSYEGNHPGMS